MPDQIEQNLQTLRDQALAVWKHHGCQECAMGELAALAAATFAFYQEQHRASPSPKVSGRAIDPRLDPRHWSHTWQRETDEF